MGKKLRQMTKRFDQELTKGETWIGSGVRDKTSWDWMELLLVPIFITLGTFYVENQIEKRQGKVSEAREKQETLKSYLNQMQELLLSEDLRGSSEDSEVRSVARSLTTITLMELDSARNQLLVSFLRESGLIQKSEEIENEAIDKPLPLLSGLSLSGVSLNEVDLSDAELSGTDLSGADLNGANLSNTDLSGTNLTKAYLGHRNVSELGIGLDFYFRPGINPTGISGVALDPGADLSGADLSGADLSGADLSRANLSRADLSDTRIGERQLDRSHLCQTAIPETFSVNADRDCWPKQWPQRLRSIIFSY